MVGASTRSPPTDPRSTFSAVVVDLPSDAKFKCQSFALQICLPIKQDTVKMQGASEVMFNLSGSEVCVSISFSAAETKRGSSTSPFSPMLSSNIYFERDKFHPSAGCRDVPGRRRRRECGLRRPSTRIRDSAMVGAFPDKGEQ
jgi:hypothetical protein